LEYEKYDVFDFNQAKAISMAIVIEGELWDEGKKSTPTKKLSSRELFASKKEVVIEHKNETYVLRITKQNKLILTK
jgi:hemin uptake protein HemP